MTVNGAHERAGDALLVRVWNRPHRLWVRVSGEVDLSNWEQLRAGLSQADPHSHGLVHLDLSELLFCDARGCQCLLDFEQAVRLAGNRVADPRRQTVRTADPTGDIRPRADRAGGSLRSTPAKHGAETHHPSLRYHFIAQ